MKNTTANSSINNPLKGEFKCRCVGKSKLDSKDIYFGLWGGLAAFLSYFCMYMYRKPFTAGLFDQIEVWGMDYKIVLVVAQVFGYALSKFLGIKIISELRLEHRLKLFVSLILVSWLALVGFAYSPIVYGPVWLFINGLPLGLIWGIVFTYCEGRRLTELITVIISANFIITSGVAKTLGRWMIGLGYTEHMMPMMVGLLVFPLLLISLWMLSRIPPPTVADIDMKKERLPMTSNEKMDLLKSYSVPISLFVIIYLILTIIRDIRDNFAVEIWEGLGYSGDVGIYSKSELWITIGILASLGLLYKIKKNSMALFVNIMISMLGFILVLFSTWLILIHQITPIAWMILSGMGMFLPYILLNGIIFDRFIATYSIVGNVGFIMYIADATGYLGSIAIMLYKNFGESQLEWLDFYTTLCMTGGVLGILLCSVLAFWIVRSRVQVGPVHL